VLDFKTKCVAKKKKVLPLAKPSLPILIEKPFGVYGFIFFSSLMFFSFFLFSSLP